MPRRRTEGPPAERFVEQALVLIEERGGSRGLSLRELSRRIGCAHTNVYNWFASLDHLTWAAYRRALELYSTALVHGLDPGLSGQAFFRRLIENLVGFAVDNPGLHRFLSSDPIDPEAIPPDVLTSVARLKRYYVDCLDALCDGCLERHEVDRMGDILLAYLDGETFNLINGRVLPDDDIVGRVLGNAERLFRLLTARTSDGLDLARDRDVPGALAFPTLEDPS